MKKKYLFIILLLITFLIILASFILFRIYSPKYSPKEINKKYSAVLLNMDDNSLIETTTIRIDGVLKKNLTVISKNTPMFTGRVKINNIPFPFALQDPNVHYDLYFFKYDNYMYSPLSYIAYNANDYTLGTLGVIYIKDIKMDKLVISLLQDGKYTNKFLVAPASNLQEGLEIYKSIMPMNTFEK